MFLNEVQIFVKGSKDKNMYAVRTPINVHFCYIFCGTGYIVSALFYGQLPDVPESNH